MKRVKTILAFLVVISIMGTGLMGYAQPNAIDKIEIEEAFETGFILLNFTEKEGGEKLEVKVTKRLSMPLIIVINEGTTTFKGWDVEIISIFTDREIKLDLSRKIEDSIVFPQTGTTRITSISTKCSFGKDTAMVFKKIQYSQDQVIEGIIAALKDEFDRQGAVIALGEIGDERAVESLIATLKDEDSNVRKNAAEALGKIGDERAVEPLKQALKDKSKDVQIWAAFGLYKSGDTQKIEFLITALKDKDVIVRLAATWALGELTDPRAVEPLITALKDEEYMVRYWAAEALEEINPKWRETEEAKRKVPEFISALKDEDMNIRSGAARALGELKDPRAVEPLITALKDEDWHVRSEAAKALNKITGEDFREDEAKWRDWLGEE